LRRLTLGAPLIAIEVAGGETTKAPHQAGQLRFADERRQDRHKPASQAVGVLHGANQAPVLTPDLAYRP
jgi:hypothetical protein